MGLISSSNVFNASLVPVSTTSFVSEPFAASVIYGPLSMPWFADYMHLVFWFFFLTTLIISIWLIQVFFLLARGGESRFPIRETRGFSRAQTGDALTAVIPMCWSITMLMHASTHSSNFDENTDNTSITMSIIAYQWGWNYFFPEDTITALGCFNGQIVAGGDVGLVAISHSPTAGELGSFALADYWFNSIGQRRVINSLCLPRANTQLIPSSTLFDNNPSETVYRTQRGMGGSTNVDILSLNIRSLLQNSANIFTSRAGAGCAVFNNAAAVCSNAPLYLLTGVDSFNNSFYSQVSNIKRNSSHVDDVSIAVWDSVKLSPAISSSLINFCRTERDSSCLPHISSSMSPLTVYKLLEDLDFDFLPQNITISTTRKPISAGYRTSLVGGLVSRLRLTSGVRLPSDTPIHIICGSQDVIHSWAVPGLSIKIDCIPGYNCHRRLLIRWRGLFWGQCMEVCGRYHHWMPLLVNVVHIDIFSMWLKSLSNVIS